MTRAYAQTNLQLYNQLLDLGYDPASVRQVKEAYHFSLQLFSGLYRGNGKPFVNHLVGTASILAAEGFTLEEVIAGLMHAAYSRGSFPLRGILRLKRRRLADVLGKEIECLVWNYHRFRMDHNNLHELAARSELLSTQERQLIGLRLANDLEDHLDNGMAFCCKTNALYHQEDNLALLAKLASTLGHSSLLVAIRAINDRVNTHPIPVALAHQQADSFHVPPSLLQRIRKYLKALKSKYESR